jgi:hypothetical protein
LSDLLVVITVFSRNQLEVELSQVYVYKFRDYGCESCVGEAVGSSLVAV